MHHTINSPGDSRRDQWIECSGNEELQNLPIKAKRVFCENHFDEKFLRRQFNRTTLRRDAIPIDYIRNQEIYEERSDIGQLFTTD